jgi:hypothetical protein
MNDDQFLAGVEEAMTWLDDAKRLNYLRMPLPCTFDSKIATVCDLFMEARPEQRAVFSSVLNVDHCSVLVLFSERMAMFGAREGSYSSLLKGLIALAMVDLNLDLREILLIFPLHYHSALKIGIDPARLFQEAAEYAGSEVAEHLRRFPMRDPKDKTLGSMGYKEVDTPNGVAYVRTW